MPFLAFLVILGFGAGLFWLISYLFRNKMGRLSLVFGIVGTLIGLFLLGLWIVEASGWQREGLYKQMMFGLENEELRHFLETKEDHYEQSVMMLSLASDGLNNYAAIDTLQEERIVEELTWMANFVLDDERFPIWKNRRNWEKETFFLTHVAVILSNYQSVTGNLEHEDSWKRICEFLAAGLTRSKYKHLPSRPKDMALRPTDNAAVLYALKKYDQYHQTELLLSASEDWISYIRKELQYEDTKLPCAGFTTTNRCRLSSVGSSLAILNTYTANAELDISKEFWREFKFYYKESFVYVFAWINDVPAGEDMPEFCDFSVAPLRCGRYENDFATYAAALRKDWITYYQFNNASLLEDLYHPPNRLWSEAPQEQLYGMISLATRLAAGTSPS